MTTGHGARAGSRRGVTLVELVVTLAVASVLAGVAVTGAGRLLDATWVQAAARDVAGLFALARERASATGMRTAVRLDEPAARVVVVAGADTLARVELAPLGITLRASRDSMAYAPSGLGYGAANLTAILTRGASAETLTVSRLGRVRRR